MPKKYLLILSGVALFFLFILFSYLVHRNHFTAIDFNTTVRLQDKIPRKFDNIFSTFSDIGKVEVMTLVLIAILIFTRKIVAGIVSLGLFVGFHLIEIYGKFFVDHAPPPQFMLRTKHIIDFPQFHVRLENSYPSGHAGRTIFISVILVVLVLQSRILNRTAKFFIIAFIACFDLTMLISRIYLGEHWTSDIIGGSILGAGLGLVSTGLLVWNKKEAKT
ncbi:MAG TPA: phosphatase PAP2 family protein [Candidatus Saccharimonadales bacterium]|nr:phosphatase PAP2 family protein [Candidatus Saccharimonadales bacterium]